MALHLLICHIRVNQDTFGPELGETLDKYFNKYMAGTKIRFDENLTHIYKTLNSFELGLDNRVNYDLCGLQLYTAQHKKTL